jgi:hypothetical protein
VGFGGNDPLFVVDGVPMSGSIFWSATEGISPGQVARIDVQKDESSTSMDRRRERSSSATELSVAVRSRTGTSEWNGRQGRLPVARL